MAENNTESSPTNICGHSAAMLFTEKTNKTPPNIKLARPTMRMVNLSILDFGVCHCLFLAGNQNEIADIDNRSQTLPENKYGVLFVYGVGQQYDTAANAEIPEGQGDYAFSMLF